MGFFKTAKIQLSAIASGVYDTQNGSLAFNKIAGKKEASNYQATTPKIDIGAMIKLVAKEYQISDDPADYIFEAARAVTAEVPNENGDAFPRSELLRFDHRLGKAVYQTFILKPHHINHRADNPKTARGMVLDASYNDLAEPLPECPGCNHKTASAEGRDPSGVNCIKCGHVVKDEFVELLIAIDRKKDPTFAEGVRKGSLNSLSMGCEAGYTDCSICTNRARNVSQFCKHIKSGNKKKIFKTASGPKMSFEKCGEVVFTEISRVDQPADPTALQKEVFTINMTPAAQTLFAERAASLKNKLARGAQLGQNDSSELDSIMDKMEEIKTTHPDLYNSLKEMLSPGEGVPEHNTIDDYAKKHEEDVDQNITLAEMGIKPEEGGLPATIATKVASNISSELDNLIKATNQVSEENKVTTPALKFAKSYKDVEALVTDKGNVRVFTPKGTLFVIRPATKPSDVKTAEKIATEILTSIAEEGLVLTASKYNAVMGTKLASILDFHMEDFDGGREDGDKGPITDGGEDKLNALPREKPSKDLQDGETHDHTEKLNKPSKDLQDDAEFDHAKPTKPADKVVEAQDESALDSHREKPPKNTLEDAIVDRADKQPKKAQMMDPMAPASPAMPMAQPGTSAPAGGMPQSAVGDMCAAHNQPACPELECKAAQGPVDPGMPMPMAAEFDPSMFDKDKGSDKEASDEDEEAEKSKKHASRLERLYKSKLEKTSKEANEKVASAEKTAAQKVQARLLRALKLAAKRQALNLEASPIKAKMFDVLATEMDLDSDSYYPGMDAVTASHIVEATVADGFDDFVEALVKRASEFLAMSDETLNAIEADVKNLQPVAISVTAESKQSAARNDVRTAAMQGNLVVAPSASNEVVPSGDRVSNIRSALGTTKLRRTSQALLK